MVFLIHKHIKKIEQLKVKSINLSIDSLNREKFAKITRRDQFDEVYKTLEILEESAINLKLNIVVQSGINTDEITDFVALTEHKNIDVRFIEEMPFNGVGQKQIKEVWHYKKILENIENKYNSIEKLIDKKSSTSKGFKIPGFKGVFGIIPAFTRTICGDCNRIRITSTGMFKNCLFDDGVFNLRDFIRNGANNDDLKELFFINYC